MSLLTTITPQFQVTTVMCGNDGLDDFVAFAVVNTATGLPLFVSTRKQAAEREAASLTEAAAKARRATSILTRWDD